MSRCARKSHRPIAILPKLMQQVLRAAAVRVCNIHQPLRLQHAAQRRPIPIGMGTHSIQGFSARARSCIRKWGTRTGKPHPVRRQPQNAPASPSVLLRQGDTFRHHHRRIGHFTDSCLRLPYLPRQRRKLALRDIVKIQQVLQQGLCQALKGLGRLSRRAPVCASGPHSTQSLSIG